MAGMKQGASGAKGGATASPNTGPGTNKGTGLDGRGYGVANAGGSAGHMNLGPEGAKYSQNQ